MQFLLDTNVLLLWLLGRSDRSYLNQHKRIREFTEDHLDALHRMVSDDQLTVTPCTLAETSNLIGDQPLAQALIKAFANNKKEWNVPAQRVVEDQAFTRLGFTDTHLLHAAEMNRLHIITVDVSLHLESAQRKLLNTNLNHQVLL